MDSADTSVRISREQGLCHTGRWIPRGQHSPWRVVGARSLFTESEQLHLLSINVPSAALSLSYIQRITPRKDGKRRSPFAPEETETRKFKSRSGDT